MQQVLASSRESKLGLTGAVHLTNLRWIEEGKITDNDIFPWLRSVQVQGYELTIVGSSLDAVRVCIEAWNAGFRAVLIIMEDEAHSKEMAEVKEVLQKLEKYHKGVGMFTYGPRMIVSEGPRCLVHLDHKGRACDVSACTNSGGLHTLAETWELFKGPAIIVDDVASVDVVRASHCAEDVEKAAVHLTERRSSFRENMERERHAFLDPQFWEDRYDPERLSFWAVSYGAVAPNLLMSFVQMLAVVGVRRYSKENYFPAYRALADLLIGLPCATALVIPFVAALGLHLRDRPTVLGICFGLAFWLLKVLPMFALFNNKLYLSDFSCCGVALVSFYSALLLFCKYVKHVKVTRPMVLWYCAVIMGTVGIWTAIIIILLAYLVMLGWNRIIASVWLSLALSLVEAQNVEIMRHCYTKFVWDPRRLQPNRVPGDQKLPLAVSILASHAFAETGRLVSMICGAVRAKDVGFLQTNAVAVIMGLLINVAYRSGWAGCLLVRCAGPRLRPYVEYLFVPTSMQGLHIDMKFAVSWPRFFLVAGLCTGRGLIHNKWNITMTGQDPGVWCWNGVVLGTTIMAFLGEVIEDWLVHIISRRWPAPQWDCFGSAMLDGFDVKSSEDIFHLVHYIVPQSAFFAPDADTTQAPTLKRSSVKSRLSSSKFYRDLAPPLLTVSPNFKQARYISAFQLQHFVTASIVMTLTVMSIGVGRGNLFGFCRPTRMDDFQTVLRDLIIWNLECESEVDL